jgi:hypothetical protein
MTSDPRNQDTEKSLERDLEEIRTVLTGPDSLEPPDLLDQAVLNNARRELENSGKRLSRRFSLRWLGAFATASVIVLALGIIVQQEQETTQVTNGNDRVVPAREEAAESQLMLKSADRDESKMRRATPMAASPARADTFGVSEKADDPTGLEEAAVEVPAPEQWIILMLQLKSSNQEQRLIEELDAFKLSYPDYPLPPELED